MDVVEMIKIAITVIALLVAIIAFVIFLKPVRNFLESKMEKEDYDNLINIATTGVRWAEQWLTGRTGQEKKTQVLKYVEDKAKEYDLIITTEDMEKAIEKAVLELKLSNNQLVIEGVSEEITTTDVNGENA